MNTNNAKKLHAALQSIFDAPPAVSHEVLVLDNASTDGSVDVVRNLFPRARLVQQEFRAGYPANCNALMRRARGEYLLVLNEDIVVLPGSVDIGVRYMDEHPDVGLLGCCMVLPDGRVQFASGRRFPTLLTETMGWLSLDKAFPRSRFFGQYLMSYWSHDTIREVETILEAGMLARRMATDQAGLMNEMLFFCYDGPDWCQRMRRAGWKVVFHPAVRIIHDEGQSSRPAGREPNYFLMTESYKSALVYYRSYHGRAYSWAYRGAMTLLFLLAVLKHGTVGAIAQLRGDQTIPVRRKTALKSLLFFAAGRE